MVLRLRARESSSLPALFNLNSGVPRRKLKNRLHSRNNRMRRRFFCARETGAVLFYGCHQPDRREGTDLHGPARTYTDAAVAANAGAIHGVLAGPWASV
jgi:hypothetical protein